MAHQDLCRMNGQRELKKGLIFADPKHISRCRYLCARMAWSKSRHISSRESMIIHVNSISMQVWKWHLKKFHKLIEGRFFLGAYCWYFPQFCQLPPQLSWRCSLCFPEGHTQTCLTLKIAEVQFVQLHSIRFVFLLPYAADGACILPSQLKTHKQQRKVSGDEVGTVESFSHSQRAHYHFCFT